MLAIIIVPRCFLPMATLAARQERSYLCRTTQGK